MNIILNTHCITQRKALFSHIRMVWCTFIILKFDFSVTLISEQVSGFHMKLIRGSDCSLVYRQIPGHMAFKISTAAINFYGSPLANVTSKEELTRRYIHLQDL